MAAASPGLALVGKSPAIAGIPVDCILFELTLLGIALFRGHSLPVALSASAVGFGGSTIRFGSSIRVSLTKVNTEAS